MPKSETKREEKRRRRRRRKRKFLLWKLITQSDGRLQICCQITTEIKTEEEWRRRRRKRRRLGRRKFHHGELDLPVQRMSLVVTDSLVLWHHCKHHVVLRTTHPSAGMHLHVCHGHHRWLDLLSTIPANRHQKVITNSYAVKTQAPEGHHQLLHTVKAQAPEDHHQLLHSQSTGACRSSSTLTQSKHRHLKIITNSYTKHRHLKIITNSYTVKAQAPEDHHQLLQSKHRHLKIITNSYTVKAQAPEDHHQLLHKAQAPEDHHQLLHSQSTGTWRSAPALTQSKHRHETAIAYTSFKLFHFLPHYNY